VPRQRRCAEARMLSTGTIKSIGQQFREFNREKVYVQLMCPRWLYQSQCKFSVDVTAGMRSGAGDGV
jgi:peptide methionine sulfoxide reductase MsrB